MGFLLVPSGSRKHLTHSNPRFLKNRSLMGGASGRTGVQVCMFFSSFVCGWREEGERESWSGEKNELLQVGDHTCSLDSRFLCFHSCKMWQSSFSFVTFKHI